MIAQAIQKIVRKQDLSYDEAYAVMDEIMSGTTTPTQNAAYLAALSTKSTHSETIEEIMGSADAMRAHAAPVLHPGMEVLEIVGTGGDHSNTFNISSTAMIVGAAAGVKVAKHGNSAATSKSGASDMLAALGVNIDLGPEAAHAMLEEVGITFLWAQHYHTSMKYVGKLRTELGFRTVFNILGPLTNPAKPEFFVLGVYSDHLLQPLAQVLSHQGVRKGMVVFGQDVMDEISACAPTSVCEINNGFFRNYEICPEDFGLPRARIEDLRGGIPEENAQITRDILEGKDKGPRRTAVVLNAGAAIYCAEKANSLDDAVALAGELIDNGSAARKLEDFIRISQQVGKNS